MSVTHVKPLCDCGDVASEGCFDCDGNPVCADHWLAKDWLEPDGAES